MQDEVKILRRIGEGAFGEVSLATCAIFGSVAVKWLKVCFRICSWLDISVLGMNMPRLCFTYRAYCIAQKYFC